MDQWKLALNSIDFQEASDKRTGQLKKPIGYVGISSDFPAPIQNFVSRKNSGNFTLKSVELRNIETRAFRETKSIMLTENQSQKSEIYMTILLIIPPCGNNCKTFRYE